MVLRLTMGSLPLSSLPRIPFTCAQYRWTYVDKRTAKVVDLRFDQSFWQRGNFPSTILNNTAAPVVLQNPWAGSGNSAPFDKAFYLSLTLGVGGTDGWFQDGQGGKSWYDGSTSMSFSLLFTGLTLTSSSCDARLH
jgi:hypothetical protein